MFIYHDMGYFVIRITPFARWLPMFSYKDILQPCACSGWRDRYGLGYDVTAGMPGPRAASGWFQARGVFTRTGLRSTGAFERGAEETNPERLGLTRQSKYIHPPAISWDAPSFESGAVWCHLRVFPHPLDDDLRGRCAGVKFPLTFVSAQQHRSIVKRRRYWSASAPAAAPLSPPVPARNTGAPTAS